MYVYIYIYIQAFKTTDNEINTLKETLVEEYSKKRDKTKESIYIYRKPPENRHT